MLPLNSMFCFYTAAHTTLPTLSDHLLKHAKNFGSNKKINFSNESVKKTTIYDFLFLIAIYFLQNVNKYISEMKIVNKQSFYSKHSFSPFRINFDDRPQIMTYRQDFSKIILGTKINVSKSQSNRLIFQEVAAQKR